MTLRRNCKELVLDVVLRRTLSCEGAEASGRVQLIADGASSKVLNSFLRMGDLHAEGVTSMELLGRTREPLPELDGLYLLEANAANVERLLEDFKASLTPQHRHVHLVLTQPMAADLLGRLAECANIAPRIKSFMEVPLSFVAIQDRGFHFDMPEAVSGLFPVPNQLLVDSVVRRLSDVLRCMQALAPGIRYAHTDLCKTVAERVQASLSALPRSSSDNQVPCQLLIVDRSIDMAAAIVHEYTYEAMVYDLLDGDCFESKHGIVKKNGQESLLSEADTLWEELKHLHFTDAQSVIQTKIAQVASERQNKDASQMKTSELLEMARSCPEQMQAVGRLDLHQFLIEKLNGKLDEEQLAGVLGPLEQDVACGVDKAGKDVKAPNLQTALTKALSEPDYKLTSEAKLRLLMLYFACMANVAEPQRQKLMEMARLDPDDQQVLMSMIRTKLMEVPDSQRHKLSSGNSHRVTKEQAARFRKNALTEGRFLLSRFEPRMKDVILNFVERRLSPDDFPTLAEGGGGIAPAAGARPATQSKDDWSFAPTEAKVRVAETGEVTRRVIVFVLGGVSHSELRAAAEAAAELPRGTEVLLGGTSLLTPKSLIALLRPSPDSGDVRATASSQATVVGSPADSAIDPV